MLIDQFISGKVTADLNIIDDSVGSLLHYAVMLSNFESQCPQKQFKLSFSPQYLIVASLVNLEQCEINITNRLGQTPLHMCKNLEVARVLLDKGASMSIRECTGKQPLFTFICSAHYDSRLYEMCVEMLKRGCDLNNVDRLGNSVLHALLLNGNAPLSLIWLLLEAGLTIDKVDLLQKDEYPNKKLIKFRLIFKSILKSKILIICEFFSRLLQKYPKLVNLIEYKLKNPPSLKALARNSLRMHLNKVNSSKSILNSVKKLENLLPSTLQEYILLNLNQLKSILIK